MGRAELIDAVHAYDAAELGFVVVSKFIGVIGKTDMQEPQPTVSEVGSLINGQGHIKTESAFCRVESVGSECALARCSIGTSRRYLGDCRPRCRKDVIRVSHQFLIWHWMRGERYQTTIHSYLFSGSFSSVDVRRIPFNCVRAIRTCKWRSGSVIYRYHVWSLVGFEGCSRLTKRSFRGFSRDSGRVSALQNTRSLLVDFQKSKEVKEPNREGDSDTDCLGPRLHLSPTGVVICILTFIIFAPCWVKLRSIRDYHREWLNWFIIAGIAISLIGFCCGLYLNIERSQLVCQSTNCTKFRFIHACGIFSQESVDSQPEGMYASPEPLARLPLSMVSSIRQNRRYVTNIIAVS